MRFLFDCGVLPRKRLAAITVDGAEIEAHRFVTPDDAAPLLSGPVRRRVGATVGRERCVYLEDGRRVVGVSA
jgi:hypothetical protein